MSLTDAHQLLSTNILIKKITKHYFHSFSLNAHNSTANKGRHLKLNKIYLRTPLNFNLIKLKKFVGHQF